MLVMEIQEEEIVLTSQGRQRIEEELDRLVTVDRHEVAARIKDAKDYGELTENAEYEAAKNAQAFVELLQAGGILSEEALTKSVTLGIGWDFAQNQAKISSIAPQGPAAKAGLQIGDVVLSLDGQPLDALQGGMLLLRKPGEQVKLTYQRGGASQQATLILGVEEAHSYRLRPLPRPTTLQSGILSGLTGIRATL